MTETQLNANNVQVGRACEINDHEFSDYDFRCKKCGILAETVKAPVRIVAGKSDADRAADLKQRGQIAFAAVLALMDEAASAGFLLRWGGIAPNAFGRHELVDLHLLKKF